MKVDDKPMMESQQTSDPMASRSLQNLDAEV